MNGFSLLDIALLVLLLYFILSGYTKGFVKQTSTILGLVIALVVAINYYKSFQPLLEPYIKVSSEMLYFISFAILFIAINIFIHLLGMILKNILDLLFLKPLDHVAGAVLGLFKGGLVAYLLVLLLGQIPYSSLNELVQGSFLAANLLDITPIIQQSLQNFFGP